MTWGLVVAGVGAVAGGYLASQGSKSAANTQAQAADNAAAEQGREFDVVQSETQPYRDMGVNALNTLGKIYGYAPVGGAAPSGVMPTSYPSSGVPYSGGSPNAFGVTLPGYDPSSGFQITPSGGINRLIPGGPLPPAGSAATAPTAAPATAPDYSSFFQSPDYNFRKQQGMQGIENSFSASGGAKSGNALKALDQYNSNLAAGEFGNYFNRQAALAGIGQTATGQSSNAAIATGANVGNSLIAAGNARASGVAGSYNAIGGAVNGLGQGLGYYLQNRGSTPNTGDYWGQQADQYSSWSDPRLKEDVKRVGKTDEGLPIYRYRMKGSNALQMGVMADEAQKKFPSAVKRDPSGYLKVNYLRVH